MKTLFRVSAYFILVVLIGACHGSQQEKLIGTWEQIPWNDPKNTSQQVLWKFYAGDLLTVYKVEDEVIIDSMFYTYEVSGSDFGIYSYTEEEGYDYTYLPGARDIRGSYWIDHLSDSNFKTTKIKHPDGTTDAVYLRIELVKR